MKLTSHTLEFLDALLPVYKKKKGGHQNTLSILSNEYFLKWSNGKAIDLGVVDTCYLHFVPFMMDEFEIHLYIHYFNCLNPSLRIQMKFKYSIIDTVKGNNFMHNCFGYNDVR